MAAQNQPPPPPPHSPRATQPQSTSIISEVLSVPIYVTLVTTTQYRMPRGYPWGMLENFMPKGYNPAAEVASFVQIDVTSAPPMVHVVPVINNEIHHAAPPAVNAMPIINDEVYMCLLHQVKVWAFMTE